MTTSNRATSGDLRDQVQEKGPWPFTTWRKYRDADGRVGVWSSRHHRKHLMLRAEGAAAAIAGTWTSALWMPRQLNWWIANVFAIGSALFAMGSLLSLFPSMAAAWSLDATQINIIFFAGSIPFTIAAYLQLFQAANAAEPIPNKTSPARKTAWVGWRPKDIGWISSALQFIGTILFNANTLDALLPSLDWLQQDLLIWVPDFVGSVLFLSSGYLAFVEVNHAYWAWKPRGISWWVVTINLLGCIAFMISAVLALVLPSQSDSTMLTASIAFTFAGAICFFLGSLLMLPEAVVEHEA